MDPNTLVFEISSDEEGDYNHIDKGIVDGGDDYNWISDILDEVNRESNCGYGNGDDSDEVVVVSEVLAKKPRKKLTSKASALLDFDDDCVVLDHDPAKPPETRNDEPKPVDRDEHVDDGSDDSDDVLVVSEKGQIACRDYPHPRHLCIKFPFSSTPNRSHCDQCYCYVCDSLAPCIYWGDGCGCLDHCLATDKDDFWVLERKNSKNVVKDGSVPPINPIQPAQTPPVAHTQIPRLNPIRVAPSFGAPNIANQDQRPSSRNRFHPGLVSQQLTRTSSCTVPRAHHSYNLSTPVHRPVFKRTASDGFLPTANQFSYNSYYRGSYRNQLTGSISPHPNLVNTSVPFSPSSNAPADFPQNFQPFESPDPFVEVPVLFQPNPVSVPVPGSGPGPIPLSSQAQAMKPSMLNYVHPPEASGRESQTPTVDPKFFHGISWPQSSTAPEGAGSINDPAPAPASRTGTVGLVDYEYDNWMFNNQPCEPRSVESLVLKEFSPDPAYLDSRSAFDF